MAKVFLCITNLEDLSYWGSFISGIVSVFTFVLTIVITCYLKNADDKRNVSQLNLQKAIFLNNLRINEYQDLSEKMIIGNIIVFTKYSNNEILLNLERLKNSITQFCIDNNLLFPFLNNSKNYPTEIIKSINVIIEFLSKNPDSIDFETYKILMYVYTKQSDIFLKKLQSVILGDLK